MKFKVSQCWGGHDKLYFRISPLDGSYRVHVQGETWTRRTATAALNLLELNGVNRRNVQFIHS